MSFEVDPDSMRTRDVCLFHHAVSDLIPIFLKLALEELEPILTELLVSRVELLALSHGDQLLKQDLRGSFIAKGFILDLLETVPLQLMAKCAELTCFEESLCLQFLMWFIPIGEHHVILESVNLFIIKK